jgi:hypothetical protein
MNIASHEEHMPIRLFRMRLVPLWLSGTIAAYFLTSFFSNFYPSTFQFVFLSLTFQLLCGTAAFLLLDDILQSLQINWQRDWTMILTLCIAFLLSVSSVVISWQFPGLFDRRILFMDLSKVPLFIVLTFISIGSTLMLLKVLKRNGIPESLKRTRFLRFSQENLPGILLALFFLFTYFTFAESLNFPEFRTLDQFFDTDISAWLARLTSTVRQDISMVRAVHPAVLMFLRPLVWFISLFLNGDRLHAVFLLHALAGASCVLLAWLIVKRASGNTTYSLIMASLLGASTSHLVLGSMLETYIYSALALIFFAFLVHSENISLKFTVPAGVLVFGITISNFIQTCILYFLKQPHIKVIAKYVLMVIFIILMLNILQVWIYPNAKPVFVPANLLIEQRYRFGGFEFSWRAIGRFSLIVRAVLLYGIVAPKPFILTKELGANFPNFRTFQITIGEFHAAGYTGLADLTVKFWMIILATAGILFILNLLKTPKQVWFSMGLVFCLGFSLVLHIVYGDDPLLYSPNWVYALVLFVALSLQKWADYKWFQIAMTVFISLMMIVNLNLIHQIMSVSLPFYGK